MNHIKFSTHHIDSMKDYTFLLLVIVTTIVLSSCRGQLSEKAPVHPNMNMDQQKRFEMQEENDFFDDKRTLRQPVAGTISRGNLNKDKVYYQGINKDSSFVNKIPVDVSKSFMNRGKDRFEVFCTPCHGNAGYGKGIIMEGDYGYVPAPSFHQDRLRDEEDGYIYSVIANGIRNMPSYGHQIPVKDRWAIVAYVRALQHSQYVPEKEVEQYDVDLASLKSEYKEKQKKAEKAKEAQKSEGGEEVSAARGKEIASNNACQSCHSIDGSKKVGPTWKNAYGHEVELESGETVTADDDYIHESIVKPKVKIVKGFPPAMVPYDQLSESKLKSLIAYIKSLSNKGDVESDSKSSESSGESTSSDEKKSEASTGKNDTTKTMANLSTSAQKGKELIDTYKCQSCHNIEGEEKFAPSFSGLYGSTVTLDNDSTVTADVGYIKESIQNPGAKIVQGYKNNMPSYKELLSSSDFDAIVAYFKALK